MARSTFTRGSGCYECGSCGRKTRDNGHGDSVGCRLCPQCFILAGTENEIQDGHRLTAPEIVKGRKLLAEITAKGGKPDFDIFEKAAASPVLACECGNCS